MSESDTSEHTEAGLPHPAALVLCLVAAVLLLYGLGYALVGLPCLGLVPVIGIIAWPIWRYRAEHLLYPRRIFIDAVSSERGLIRRMFWRGEVALAFQALVAVGLALLLLGMTANLQPAHWAILVTNATLLGVLFAPVQRSLATQIHEQYQSLVARRWPLTAFNVVFLVVSISALEFYVIDRPDTRGLGLLEVAPAAFAASQSAATCPLVGILLGTVSAGEGMAWHLAMTYIPTLSNLEAKLLVWIVFLAWISFGAFLFTRFLLGVITLVESWSANSYSKGKSQTTSRAFWATILTLAVPYVYLTGKVMTTDGLPIRPQQSPLPQNSDPCKDSEFEVEDARAKTTGQVAQAQSEAYALIDRRVDAVIDRTFGAAEKGVERYLDWYFSLIGEYTRLGTAFTGDPHKLMMEQLERHLLTDTNLLRDITDVSERLEQALQERMGRLAESIGTQIGKDFEHSRCPIGGIDLSQLLDLERDKLRASVSAALGTGSGTLTAKYLATKPAAGIAGKLAMKSSVKTAGGLLVKGAIKKGGSILIGAGAATAICSPTGPIAVVCGITAGIIIWVTVDKAMIEIDEVRLRDDMRDQLLTTLHTERDELRETLKQNHKVIVDANVQRITATTNRVFNPSRDGQ